MADARVGTRGHPEPDAASAGSGRFDFGNCSRDRRFNWTHVLTTTMSAGSVLGRVRHAIGAAFGLVWRLVTRVLLLGLTAVWIGLWSLVAWQNYQFADTTGAATSVVLVLAAVALLLRWLTSTTGVGTRLVEAIDAFTPSTPSASGD